MDVDSPTVAGGKSAWTSSDQELSVRGILKLQNKYHAPLSRRTCRDSNRLWGTS